MDATRRTLIVYVHGLWLGGAESLLLRRRLARALDADTVAYPYDSMTGDLASHARALGRFLDGVRADTLHLIGHSLGGVLVVRTFELGYEPAPPGRVVLLGSPVLGSEAARRFARLPFGGRALGPVAREALLDPPARRWSGRRDLGVIAGDRAAGLGRLLGRLPAASDGTVMVAETGLPGARAYLTVPVGHSGLVFSAEVARRTGSFLARGRF